VANVTGYATASVSEHVFALMLALKRRLPGYQRLVAAGQWQRSHQFGLLDFPITELAGRTLGIVGYGELGQAVARVAEAFGMSVRIASRPGIKADTPPQAGRVVLNQLLTEADILTLHCPLNDNTRNLIGANELALMKSDAVLINTARGGIVDEQALADALRSGQIGGAAVDVLSQEPPVSGNPLLAADIPNLIVTPHIAWASRESRQRLIHEIAINIRAWMRGEDRNRLC
jgi:glycerate dehydrogenase